MAALLIRELMLLALRVLPRKLIRSELTFSKLWCRGYPVFQCCTMLTSRARRVILRRSIKLLVLGIEVRGYGIRSLGDFDETFAALKRDNTQALLPVTDPLIFSQREQIVHFANDNRIPGVYEFSLFVNAGGLMSYGPNLNELFKRGAYYVDMILKGTKPANLPVEQPTKFELAINLKTAKALGLTIPETLLATADKVIE